jgi:hypothetical protein
MAENATDVKEANKMLLKMVKHYLEKCKTGGLVRKNTSYELEVSFGNRKTITRNDYEDTINHLMRFGWKSENLRGDEMLRINSEFLAVPVETEDEVEVKRRSDDSPGTPNIPPPRTPDMTPPPLIPSKPPSPVGSPPLLAHSPEGPPPPQFKAHSPEGPPPPQFKAHSPEMSPPSSGGARPNGGPGRGGPGRGGPGRGGPRLQMSANFRLEIKGSKLIQEYCKSDSIDAIIRIDPDYKTKMKFTEKKLVKEGDTLINMAKFQDHNFRVAYKQEIDYEIDDERSYLVRDTLRNWNGTKKTFRCMNRVRFTHDMYPIFVDVSVIKTNSKIKNTGKRDYLLPTSTLASSNAFSNEPSYEIELEIDNMRMEQEYRVVAPEKMIEMIKKCIRMVLSGLQDTPYPVAYSEQEEIYTDYMALIHGSENPFRNKKHRNPETNDFIGPQSIALQQFNLFKDEFAPQKNQPKSALRNYMVTEKADGQRALLYISKIGKIYMINSRMKIIFTGAKTEEKKCFNSLLDGEFIMTGKDKKILFLYAAFDIYYIGSRKEPNVRPFAFYPENVDVLTDAPEKTQFRLPLLEEFVKLVQPKPVVAQAHTSCLFRIQSKKFSSGVDVFEACNSVLSSKHSHPYETDGLILTPMFAGVGGDKPNTSGPLKKYTWNLSFKWKPPEYNTIDFYVITEKDKNKDLVRHIIHDSENINKAVAYNTLYLHVGVNKKFEDDQVGVFQRVLEDRIGANEVNTEDETSNYVPRIFKPTTPYDPTAFICYIPLDEQMRMKTVPVEADGTPEVFDDLTIVEFRYAQPHENKEGHWKWIPIRVRHDKTAILRSNNAKDYGNSFLTANSNWLSIHSPVTENMVRGLESIRPNEVEDDQYYDVSEKEGKYTVALKDFHNKYVKNKLISNAAKMSKSNNEKVYLIDFSVGRAGDLTKWKYSNIDFVLGIDLSKDNIMNRLDSACARYLDMRKKNKQAKLRAIFFQGDSGKNIRSNQEAFSNTTDKQLIKSIFGKGEIPNKRSRYVFDHGMAADGFHISSCQFALHYFFQSLHTLHRFLRNVSECTRLNGYFIGTCFDGESVFRALKNPNGQFVVDKNTTTLCKITKKYDAAIEEFPSDESSVGLKIDVFQESIGNTISEYLVSFEYLTRVLGNYGFVSVPKQELLAMNFEASQGSFASLFTNMEKEKGKDFIGKATQLSPDEKKISFLNRYFIFKKTTDISESALKNMLDTLGDEKKTQDDMVEEKVAEKVAETIAERKLSERIVMEEESDDEEMETKEKEKGI